MTIMPDRKSAPRLVSVTGLLALALLMFIGLAACQPGQVRSTPVITLAPSSTPAPTATPAPTLTPTPALFNGEQAYSDVQYQEALGPRVPGSRAHEQIIAWMQKQLQNAGWQVELQETTYRNQAVRNVIARRSASSTAANANRPWVILGAHFDSRQWADRDPDPKNHQLPVPGANDGASGVAVLLELARVLPQDLDQDVWLVFFDAEDQGNIPGWDWVLGSRAFAESLTSAPDAVVVIDMIGDANLNPFIEKNSNPELAQEILDSAAGLGYREIFIATPNYTILDDHTPFLERGYPALDIIDFNYPQWHTRQDTSEFVSAQSLHKIGRILQAWLETRP